MDFEYVQGEEKEENYEREKERQKRACKKMIMKEMGKKEKGV